MKLIHKYNMNGYNIVVDVNGGAVHVVDDVTYRVLDYYEDKKVEDIVGLLAGEFSEDKVREAYEEIEGLVEEGLLYSEDEYEFHPSFVNRQPVVKALCLNVAHDCNLKCKYCFAKQGDFGGKAELMPLEVGKKAIDYLIANSGSRKNLEIDFFGGEPLMN
ncbi:MAG: 4Fe-4S cluster-binding domain-containing protein, partial [Peptostreptococcus sp.]